jgi:hypothetical protein
MHEPYAHTLTPADRNIVSRWLLGISAAVGTLTLLAVGIAIVNQHRGPDRPNETAAMQANQR